MGPSIREKIQEIETGAGEDDNLSRQSSLDSYYSVEEYEPDIHLPRSNSILNREVPFKKNVFSGSVTRKIHYHAYSDEIIGQMNNDSSDNNSSISIIEDTLSPCSDGVTLNINPNG